MKNPVSINPMPVYQAIATALEAYQNCIERNNYEWEAKHEATIRDLCKHALPSGSGIDKGTIFDFDASNPNRLVFDVAYHHMNENGYYDGWSQYRVIVTPRLANNLTVHITGRDRNDTKEYLHEVYHSALTEMLEANRPVTGLYVDVDGNPHGEEPTIGQTLNS